MRSLYLFTHDLRLHDNALLHHLAQASQQLHCVYIFDDKLHSNTAYQTKGLSENRQGFLSQSLAALAEQLQALNQQLHCMQGDSFTIIKTLQQQYQFNKIGITYHTGVYEQQLRQRLLAEDYPLVSDSTAEQFTLLTSNLHTGTDTRLNKINGSFTQFRKTVEPLIESEGIDCAATITSLPPPILVSTDTTFSRNEQQQGFCGGEAAALAQLHYYCEPGRLDIYKETRNNLFGWDFSSKLSPWLANGCLSVRTVWQTIEQFETNNGSNDSTYWLKFELLWREYFQWLLLSHQTALFSFSGIHQNTPDTTFNQDRYQAWINGQTGFAGVDAAMRQLRQTGWLSNRARQWVASCFIHELNLDWRYGAAFFEQELIDFDVASNWGNWQYLAGVGTDPRGSRHFNLDKQLALYDKEGLFCAEFSD